MNLALALPSAPPPATPTADASSAGGESEANAFGELLDNASEVDTHADDATQDLVQDSPDSKAAPQLNQPASTPPAPILWQLIADQSHNGWVETNSDAASDLAAAPTPSPESATAPAPPPASTAALESDEPPPAPSTTAPTSATGQDTSKAAQGQTPPPTAPPVAPLQAALPSPEIPAATAPPNPAPEADAIAATAPITSTLPPIARPANGTTKSTTPKVAADTAQPGATQITPAPEALAAADVQATEIAPDSAPDSADAMAPRIQSERGQSQGDTLAGVNQKAAASVDSAEQNTTAAPTIQPAPATPAPTDTAKVTHPLSIAHAGAQVAHEIVRRFDGDTTTFDLRLDPPELGRVEVRLEVSRDNKVTAVVTADNPQTLAEMARNARDLQSALQGAGLDLADNGLSFDLRQGGRENGDRQGAGTPANQSSLSTDAADAPIARIVSLDPWRGSAIDLMA